MSKKKKSAAVAVTFRSPSFIHKGQKYLSKDVEAAAQAGDEDAQLIIADLVRKGSGVISIEEDVAPADSKPNSRRGKKGDESGTETEDQDA